jgi:hypothetical protein
MHIGTCFAEEREFDCTSFGDKNACSGVSEGTSQYI